MDDNYKRHGKKTDQETQSPVLKVFKEMIQRENNDPEKANLLKEKQDRKRRQYSGSRSKSDHRLPVNHQFQRAHESSSSERRKRNIQYKVAHHDHKNREYTQCRTQSIPFQGDTKEGWWFWGGDNKRQQQQQQQQRLQQQQQQQLHQQQQQNKETKKKLSEDTCSCVSCALKQIIGSEYACMACLGLLFAMSVLAAFLIVFKTVPITATGEKTTCLNKVSSKMKSQDLKKKIDMLQSGRGYGDEAALSSDSRRTWDDTASRYANGIAGLTANDYGDTGYRDWSTLEDGGLPADSELNSILDPEKMREGLSDEKLRNFYKKLIKTDAQIRKLKKSASDYPGTSINDGKFNFLSDRRKRSLRLANSRGLIQPDTKKSRQATKDEMFDISKFNLYFPPYSAVTSTTMNTRKVKRFINGTDEPSGYLLEKKQILVQYKPNGIRKVPKCSHVPKDSKSHEKQLKHPFYKNSQRLDEMLDLILDRKLPELMADPFGVETLFNADKKKLTIKPQIKVLAEKVKANPPFLSKTIDSRDGPTKNFMMPYKTKEQVNKHIFFLPPTQGTEKTTTTTSPYCNVLLSVSTIIDPTYKKMEMKPMLNVLQKSPHMRKLMQANEEDDEIVGYEDMNEVLSDATETRDDTEKGQLRKKRMHQYPAYVINEPNNPYHTKPVVNNPAWKGPMPLYPDELTSMIKQAALQNVHNANKIKVPSNKDASAVDSLESQLNDMEYIENYSDNKYNKLAKMAQAYSDYGVLAVKKESRKTENNQAAESKPIEHRIKLSITKGKPVKRSFFDRFKKGSEGLRFEVRPTTCSREDDGPFTLGTSITQHFKFGHKNKKPIKPKLQTQTTASDLKVGEKNMDSDFALFSSVHRAQKLSEASKLEQKHQKRLETSTYTLNFLKGKSRSLLSILETEENNSDQKQIQETDETFKTELLKESSSPEHDILRTVLDVDAANVKSNNHTTNMYISDFFLMVSSWFSALAGSAFNYYNITKPSGNNSTITSSQTEKLRPGYWVLLQSNKSKDFVYPNYDADVIENIGHRSRILMSVKDFKQNTDKYSTTVGKDDDIVTKAKQVSDRYTEFDVANNLKLTSVVLTTFPDEINTNKTKSENLEAVTPIIKNPSLKDNNKTVVKRNAIAGGNLIFWNDIYDDEYGVKSDPLDKAIRDKQYGKGIDFVKRSGSWIHDKVKNLANNIRGKDKTGAIDYMSKRSLRGTKYLGTESNPQYNTDKKYRKRSANHDEEESDGQVSSFGSLTLKMKEVCKEAAQAVQQTRNIQIRQNEIEDTMTTSLIQQLVRLMTDLIDFQVQQKTCIKLPPDLQEFLGWMTSTKPEKLDTTSSKTDLTDDDIDQTLAPVRMSELEDLHPSTKSNCIGILHSIDDLLQQYDEMSEEDKGKMTEVKDYLDNQHQFFNKLLDDEVKTLFPTYQDTENSLRFKRHVPYNKFQMAKYKYRPSSHEKKRRYKRKFLKNFGKKHTRTTHSIYDGFTNTEMDKSPSKPGDDSARISNADKLRSNEVNKGTIEEKRNLKDVYYKAIADAKKYTTIKHVQDKDDVEGFDNARIVRIEK